MSRACATHKTRKASGAEVRTEAYEKSSLASASLGGDAKGINSSNGGQKRSDLSSFLHEFLHKTRRH